MITISKNANPNYLCKIVELKGLQKHSNADRLQTVNIDFQTVITGLDAKDGDVYVYFPVECKINKDFLSATNSFRHKELNADPEKAGFFEDNCRVRAMRLRGEKSMGYIVPAEEVFAWANYKAEVPHIGEEFDTINGKLLVEKYVVKTAEPRIKEGKKPKVSRLIDGQVRLHVDTENLRKNVDKVRPEDIISITYKTHGTSWWVSNALVKKNLKWYEKLLKKIGVNIVDTEYDLVYGSRRVVKNESMDDPKKKDHFYGYDLWEGIKDEVGHLIPKGYTLYGEMLGYDKNGAMIQKGYDYGCKEGEHKLEVYRITTTNIDGVVTELSYPEIVEFCNKVGLTPSYLFYYGTMDDYIFTRTQTESFYNEESKKEFFIKVLEERYNEKDCFMCNNTVPEEGVVVRVDDLFEFKAYKLKSFRFLEKETQELDAGIVDVESEN